MSTQAELFRSCISYLAYRSLTVTGRSITFAPVSYTVSTQKGGIG
jgi:hypothetical protein